jgi:hypothetical protein
MTDAAGLEASLRTVSTPGIPGRTRRTRLLTSLRVVAWLAVLAAVYTVYVLRHPPGDLSFYYNMLIMAQRGLHPFIDYWSEYPPLFPLLLIGLEHAVGPLLWHDSEGFSRAYFGFMTVVYVANLVLVWDLTRLAYGTREARRSILLYSCCVPIAWFTLGWFDGIAVLLLLLALRALVAGGARRVGLLIGLGILVKIFPAVLLLAAPAALGRRGTLRLALTLATVLLVVVAPLALIRSDLLWATATSLMTRPAWETLPAVLAGNYVFGVVAPLTERFTAETAQSSPSPYSGLSLAFELTTAGCALAATWYCTRRRNMRTSDLYALVAFSMCALLLGSKGFSPQYLLWLLPLVVLVWPNRIGMLYVLAFSVYAFLYVDFWFPDLLAGYFQPQTISLEQVAHSAWSSAISRTALLLMIGSHLLIKIIRLPSCARDEQPHPGMQSKAIAAVNLTATLPNVLATLSRTITPQFIRMVAPCSTTPDAANPQLATIEPHVSGRGQISGTQGQSGLGWDP